MIKTYCLGSIFSIYLILFASSLIASENSWNYQYPLPSGNNLWGISFPNDSIGYITGGAGTVIKYSSNKFNLMPKIDSIYLKGCRFFDENNGFAVGGDFQKGYVAKTTDGAKTWEITVIDELAANSLSDICFVNKKTAYTWGWGDCIYKSDDSCKTWKRMPNVTKWNIKEFQIVNDSLFFLVGSGGDIYRSKNPEVGWEKVYENQNMDFRSLYFVDSLTGYVCGMHGVVVKTTDGGNTWQELTNGNWYSYCFLKIYFCDKNNGIVFCTFGVVAYTNDGGKTWLQAPNKTAYAMNAYNFKKDKGWAVGEYGAINRIEGFGWGTETVNSFGYTDNLDNIKFYDDNLGFSTGNFGYFLKTTNGGKDWIKKETGLSANISCLLIISKDTLLIGTTSGEIYRSADAGESWVKMTIKYNSHSYSSLNSICFSTKTTAWAVGYNGIILNSTDAGETWLEKPKAGEIENTLVSFADLIHGVICDISGVYYYTSDGGDTWSIRTDYCDQIIKTVQFVNPLDGWMVTKQNVYSSTDAGITWIHNKHVDSNTYEFLKGVFKDKNTGWVIGSYAPSITKTTDGGNTWNISIINEEVYIKDVCFVNEKLGWVCGLGGLILNTKSGGITNIENKIEDVHRNKLLIYPNPANDYIEINPDAINTMLKHGVDEGSDIQIINTIGEIVLSVEQTPPSVRKINISNLPPGIYLIKIGKKVEKFVKI